MSGKPHDANATIDQSSGAPLNEQFEAAWQQAIKGGNPPSVEGYLAQVAEAERPTLRTELTRIESEYRPRYAQYCSLAAVRVLNNESLAARTDPEIVGSAGTITVPPQPSADPNATVDPVRAGAIANDSGNPQHTIGFADAPVDPAATIDPEDAGRSATHPVQFVQPRPGIRRVAEAPQVEGYEVLGELGRGGMGVVYKARQAKLNRLVALKMVLAGAHAGESELARFYTEAEAVAALQHPNIVQIYDVGEHDGLPYFSLEYVDGGSLNHKLGGEPQPPRDAAHLIESLALAMGYAHLHGIIHRDLKPANVLITKDGQPKITDFGLAKKLEDDSGQTKSGTLMGTPNYMAPEQARGDTKDVGPLADVYALGVILYQMLTGRTPFIGTSILDTLQQVKTQEPVPPTRLQPKLPKDLETVCLKCLQKEPHKRYPSADALADDLHRFLAGEPIRARPVGNAERLWRWCQRNPRVATLSAAVLLLLVTVAIGSTVMAVRISFEHAQAVAAQAEAEKNAAAEKEARLLADQHELEALSAKKRADENAQIATANAITAERQSDLALRTMQILVNKIQQQLEDEPRTQKLKRDLLQTAQDGLTQIADNAAKAGSSGATMIGAHVRMGAMFRQLGDTEAAFKEYQLAHEIAQKRATAQPKNDASKGNLAATISTLGDMSQELRRDMKAALRYYRQALALREELYQHPNGGEGSLEPLRVKQALSEAYTRVAVTILRLGDPAGSLGDFQKTLSLREELSAANPTNESMRQDLARTYNAIGEVCFLSNDLPAARTYYEKCLGVRETLHRAKPDNPRFRRELAAACGNFGDINVRTSEPQTARPHYERSLVLSRELAESDPENVDYRRELGIALYRVGSLEQRLQEPASEGHFRECLQIREELAKNLKNDLRQIELMLVLPRVGQHARAAGMADTIRGRVARDPEALLEVARCFAQCSAAVPDDVELRGRYLARAVEVLVEAVAGGYRDVVSLELDTDLEPVRSLAGFQELLKQIRAKASAPDGER